MQGMPPPAADERQTLIEFLRFNQNAFFAVAYGLTDEQARSKPSVSALSIGGLVKHAAGVQHSWMARVKAAPDSPPRDERPFEEQVVDYEDQYVRMSDGWRIRRSVFGRHEIDSFAEARPAPNPE